MKGVLSFQIVSFNAKSTYKMCMIVKFLFFLRNYFDFVIRKSCLLIIK